MEPKAIGALLAQVIPVILLALVFATQTAHSADESDDELARRLGHAPTSPEVQAHFRRRRSSRLVMTTFIWPILVFMEVISLAAAAGVSAANFVADPISFLFLGMALTVIIGMHGEVLLRNQLLKGFIDDLTYQVHNRLSLTLGLLSIVIAGFFVFR